MQPFFQEQLILEQPKKKPRAGIGRGFKPGWAGYQLTLRVE